MSRGFEILTRRLESQPDAMSLFQACTDISNPHYRLLLESSETGSNGRQQSILFLQSALKITARQRQVHIEALTENGQQAINILQHALVLDDDISLDDVSDFEITLTYPDTRMVVEEHKRIKRLTTLDAVRQLLTILAGDNHPDAEKLIVAGVVGYDYVNMLESLPELHRTEDDFPDLIFLVGESQIVIDGNAGRTEVRQIIFDGDLREPLIGQARGRLTLMADKVSSVNEAMELDTTRQFEVDFEQLDIQPDKTHFKQQVAALKDAIDEGRIFQAVISRQFKLDCDNPELAYSILAKQNPSPYQFFLNLGKYTLFGASPESSLRYNHRDRTISIMPIAGTRGRGRDKQGRIDLELDARLEADLKLDEKELAEHLMLVDLARNDLARIAEAGSRHVSELMAIYRYASVMHMVSRVDATLATDLDIFHACQACFHMGTLSGAPKAEAMTLISEIEQRPRGTYGGAVGYFNAAGDMDSAIVIRSALVENSQAIITAGAGIVYDSNPDMEVRETELKASSVIRAIQLSQQVGGKTDE
jgi:anthranilate synthase component 1